MAGTLGAAMKNILENRWAPIVLALCMAGIMGWACVDAVMDQDALSAAVNGFLSAAWIGIAVANFLLDEWGETVRKYASAVDDLGRLADLISTKSED